VQVKPIADDNSSPSNDELNKWVESEIGTSKTLSNKHFRLAGFQPPGDKTHGTGHSIYSPKGKNSCKDHPVQQHGHPKEIIADRP
jgi:hypothetical protein